MQEKRCTRTFGKIPWLEIQTLLADIVCRYIVWRFWPHHEKPWQTLAEFSAKLIESEETQKPTADAKGQAG